MKSKYKSFVLYSTMLVCFLVLSPAFSETILLKNGQILSGKILDQNLKDIVLQEEDGTKKSIPSYLIRKITFKTKKEVEEELVKEKLKKAKTNLEKNSDVTPIIIEKPDVEIIPSRTRILLYSAILPGLGQYKEGRRRASYYWFGSLAALTVASAALYEDAASKRRTYEKTSMEFGNNTFIFSNLGILNSSNQDVYNLLESRNISNDRKAMLSAANLVNSASSLFLAFYLANLLDAYLFYPTDKQSISIKVIPELMPMTFSQAPIIQTNSVSRIPYIQVQWEYRF
ncbi:hypothetical protein EHQ58_10560 [Leptospira ognonensis]|uniref:Uncharacterized protein n=1 Tax=Leptospira ognonensis TaxID=2484945 RepID=A0A4R9JXC5_9LEPT|nr:DUF5683 domain-containing protein [Leptospira ognonensis]TGL57847.1 hypothetical protein EHQ58_10560 [Leptospira ognonensis]